MDGLGMAIFCSLSALARTQGGFDVFWDLFFVGLNDRQLHLTSFMVSVSNQCSLGKYTRVIVSLNLLVVFGSVRVRPLFVEVRLQTRPKFLHVLVQKLDDKYLDLRPPPPPSPPLTH